MDKKAAKKTYSSAAKAQKLVHQRHENAIPDYEFLFDENAVHKNKPVKLMGQIMHKNLWQIVFGAVLYIIKASPVWAMPLITAEIINVATAPGDDALQKIAIYAVLLTLFLAQNVPMHAWYAKVSNKMLRDTSAGLKSMVVRKLQSLSITYHKQMETGKIQSKFLKDTDMIDSLFSTIVYAVLPNIIGVIIAVGISAVKSGTVTLFFMLIIPCNVLLAKLFGKVIRRKNSVYRKQTENMSAKLSNMLEMLSVTKAHGLESEEIQTFDRSILRLRDSGLSVDKTNAYFGSLSWVMSNLLSALCLLFCAYLAIRKEIGVGDIVLYQTLFGSINGYILSLINVVPQFGQGMEAIASVSEIMLSDDVENNIGKADVPEIEGKVDFDDVSYRYPDSAQFVIKNFSLHVAPGECIAVVGASGSGKSTIMNLIIGFLKPTEGALYIDGKNINDIDLSQYRHHISVVPQNSILFSGTIRENITYGLTYYDENELMKAVSQANVNEFVKNMPDGLDTEIGEHGGKLSGGQKQRITIARALIRQPRILIFDEATSALDNISEYHVQKAISAAIKGRTTFIVAHRLSTIRGADRIIVMDNGVCVESGTYGELMAQKGKFYELKRLNDMNAKTADEALDGNSRGEEVVVPFVNGEIRSSDVVRAVAPETAAPRDETQTRPAETRLTSPVFTENTRINEHESEADDKKRDCAGGGWVADATEAEAECGDATEVKAECADGLAGGDGLEKTAACDYNEPDQNDENETDYNDADENDADENDECDNPAEGAARAASRADKIARVNKHREN